jgi:hypothetical protein
MVKTRPVSMGESLMHAAVVFDAVLKSIGKNREMKGRAGGYLCIADRTGVPLLVAEIGSMPEEKRKQYLRNALEKAERLSYTSRYGDHVVSRQSRDESRERWIGAVCGRQFIYSFSGLPEDGDELFVILLAFQRASISENDVRRCLAENKYRVQADRLIKKFAP